MDESLLERFFKGECSIEEQKTIIDWYLSGKADQELSKKITAYWEKGNQKDDDQWGREELFEAIDQQITPSPKTAETKIKQISSSGNNSRLWYYSAAAVLLILLGGLWYLGFKAGEQGAVDQTKYITEQTLKGERRTVSLPDGTVARLNADSRLWYAENFNRDAAREVFMEGEIFLDVSKDPNRTFKVHTGNVVTTVWGTSFNVNALDPTNHVSVSLVSGEVKVERYEAAGSSAQPVHLRPGEQAVYSREDPFPIKRNFDYPEVLSWTDGVLYFKNEKFADIVNTLESWYDIEIVVRRQGIEDGFSGVYDNTALETVLEGMGFVLGFDYEINNKTIIIK